jgi:hypothetical protein
MRRALFTFVAAVSLALFLATVVLWVRGQWKMDHFWLIHRDEGSELIRSAAGRITVRHNTPNARDRITFPRRVSHWSCAVGSQLPPAKSRLHWQWRFLTYEGVPAPTDAERRAARTTIDNALKLRASLGIPANLSEDPWRRLRNQPNAPQPPLLTQLQQMQLYQSDAAARMAQSVLDGSSYWEWTFPAWLAALVLATPPALWVVAWQRRRRILREGRCPGCGYDLRASRERCPECGLAFAGRHGDAAPSAAAPPGAMPPDLTAGAGTPAPAR